MIAVEVTLSKWLYNAVQAHEVLTIHRDISGYRSRWNGACTSLHASIVGIKLRRLNSEKINQSPGLPGL